MILLPWTICSEVSDLMAQDKVFAYPNPVESNKTRIRYFVGDADHVEIMIFDYAGEYVRTLQDNQIIVDEYISNIWIKK